MGVGKFFKSLFGGSATAIESPPAEEPIEYKGFLIEAAPIKEGSQYRTAGFITGEKPGDSEKRRIQFIRADSSADRQSAVDHSVGKARQIIDEQGVGLLDRTHL